MSYFSYFPRQMTKYEKAEKAQRTIARLARKGISLAPIAEFSGRIARTFWGKAWCDNIESYRDYAYRLERGRSYVRSGAVIDLKIGIGSINALVIGSSSRPYSVSISIRQMAASKWETLVQRAAGKITSLMALSQGELPEDLLTDFCNPETGLFPNPREIKFDCSCPDGASCCKHVAAVLYGVGRRLDDDPSLFFTLRGIDPNKIVTADVIDTLTADTTNELAVDNLGDVFGISLDEAPVALDPPRPKAKSKAVRPKSADKTKCAVKAKPSAKSRAAAAKAKCPACAPLSEQETLREIRKRLNLTQAELARMFQTSQTVISLIERGKMSMKPQWQAILDGISFTRGGARGD